MHNHIRRVKRANKCMIQVILKPLVKPVLSQKGRRQRWKVFHFWNAFDENCGQRKDKTNKKNRSQLFRSVSRRRYLMSCLLSNEVFKRLRENYLFGHKHQRKTNTHFSVSDNCIVFYLANLSGMHHATSPLVRSLMAQVTVWVSAFQVVGKRCTFCL